MSTQINVVIRMRPYLCSEKKSEENQIIKLNEEKNTVLVDKSRFKQEFSFYRVLGSETTQLELYERSNLKFYVCKVLEGYNSTIFTYGHTGAGKTYTMEGPSSDKTTMNENNNQGGIIAFCIRNIFNNIENFHNEKQKYKVSCSYLQIYNEKIFDLLNPSQFSNETSFKNGLKLRYKDGEFQVENLLLIECQNANDAFKYVKQGISNRVVATSKFNHLSSRSHAVLTLVIEASDSDKPEYIIMSKLHLVDLAGSERFSIDSSNYSLQKEGIEINKSLFTLRQVILTINEVQKGRASYIPYRDSKLTSILCQSIGGNSYSLMISNIAPTIEFLEENISTLNYSSKASIIKNNPEKNIDPKIALINELKAKNIELVRELKDANEYIVFLTQLANNKCTLREATYTSPSNNQYQSRYSTKEKYNVTQYDLNPKIKEHEKTAELEKLTSNIGNDKDNMMERIVQSVNMVKEVLQSNMKLRDEIQKLIKDNDMKRAEIYHLSSENEEVKEKLKIIEEINHQDTNKESNKNNKEKEANPISFAEKFLNLQKENNNIQRRLNDLELENNLLRRNENNQFANSEFEPIRAIIDNDLNNTNISTKKIFSQFSKRSFYNQTIRHKLFTNSNKNRINHFEYKKDNSFDIYNSNLLTNIRKPSSGANFVYPNRKETTNLNSNDYNHKTNLPSLKRTKTNNLEGKINK